jgi:hypothetical protein
MNKARFMALTVAAVLTVLGVADHSAHGQELTPAERGREIASEADRRARGFGDYRARLDMILHDRRGKETRRELELYSLEISADEERSLVYFHSPRDIRGTGLLTYSQRDREDEQWLYLPALRRTKRISSSGRSSPFMGSEFAYEDLAPTFVSQYEYSYVRQEECEGLTCFVVERYPNYEGTGYRRQQLWIDVDEYRVLRVDSWDLRDRQLKTLTLSAYERYVDRVWKPGEALMVNHRTEETTLLRWYDYQFETGLTENDFSRAALARVR